MDLVKIFYCCLKRYGYLYLLCADQIQLLFKDIWM